MIVVLLQVTLMESSLLKCLPLLMFGGDIKACVLGDNDRVDHYPGLLVDEFYSMQCEPTQANAIVVSLKIEFSTHYFFLALV